MSYGSNLLANWKRGAAYTDRILKGAHPGELPIAQPTTFELVINLNTAATLGVTIPPALLTQADQIMK